MLKSIFVLLIVIIFCSSCNASSKEKIGIGKAVVLGVVEGLTEYLPISSTGHLNVAEKLLGVGINKKNKNAIDAYTVCIQFGAIIAVLWLYYGRIKQVVLGILGRNKKGRILAINLLIAFLPAVIIGLLFEKHIKTHLFGMVPVIIAWFIGGFVILLMSRRVDKSRLSKFNLDSITYKQALIIGLIQCIAMWPGVSRSLAVILGAVFVGLSLPAAVEFSFLLGLITLSAAAGFDAIKHGGLIVSTFGIVDPIIGGVAAFVSAIFAVKWMVNYLNQKGMNVFGYYRITAALIIAILLLTGIIKH